MSRKTENWGMSPARKEPDTRFYSGRLAVRLRSLREKTELTPEEVAEKMGVSLATVYNWESGYSFPNTEQLLLYANVLGLKSVRTLFPEK
jgi:transcriptional regulator with XRE-family HTH domain